MANSPISRKFKTPNYPVSRKFGIPTSPEIPPKKAEQTTPVHNLLYRKTAFLFSQIAALNKRGKKNGQQPGQIEGKSAVSRNDTSQ